MKWALGLVSATALLFLVLVLPNHPDTLKWTALSKWPLELPVLLLLMMAAGQQKWLRYTVTVILVCAIVVKIADYAMFTAFNRTFNPILDSFLLGAGASLFWDTFGGATAVLAGIGIAVFVVFLTLALERSLRIWSTLAASLPIRAAAAAASVFFAGWAIADAGHHLGYWTFDKSPPGSAWTTRLTVKRAVTLRETAVDLRRYAAEAQNDQYADSTNLLNGLNGHDVLLLWIESYGRASFDNPLYAPTHLKTLRRAEDEIARTGMAMRSGWLTSPTAGGQSWLAHGSLASGLWTPDHARYQAMLASGRNWLFHIAQDAGYRTSAIMPAITMGWPESLAMGFDLVIPAADIPYEGDRFRWVTMPDQFTLSVYSELLPPDPRPDFIQIALISSHAPWTPIADMVPWESVGNGTIFNEMAARGPTPKELWRDRDAVRDAYRRSVDYALQVVFSYVARKGDDAPLIIVAGDHQAASFIAGSENKDVAVHIIGPPALVDRIAHWDWTPGLIPADNGVAKRMDSFRDDFITAFTQAQLSQALAQ